MKKFALLFICALALVGCEIEDDGPGTEQVLVEVVDIDLPETLEQGKIYQLEVTYKLPNACHVALGVQVALGGFEPPKNREVYVGGVASRPAGNTQCTMQSENLLRKETFALRIIEDEPYTFYLWTGLDENQENVYTEIVVPVEQPSET